MCQMEVDTEKVPTELQTEYKGERYFFCAPG
ncbi:MAG: hypothetical protein V2G33_08190 [bacterium JZ-2024 1]